MLSDWILIGDLRNANFIVSLLWH